MGYTSASIRCGETQNPGADVFQKGCQSVNTLFSGKDHIVERHIKYTKKIKLNARRHNVKFRSIQII